MLVGRNKDYKGPRNSRAIIRHVTKKTHIGNKLRYDVHWLIITLFFGNYHGIFGFMTNKNLIVKYVGTFFPKQNYRSRYFMKIILRKKKTRLYMRELMRKRNNIPVEKQIKKGRGDMTITERRKIEKEKIRAEKRRIRNLVIRKS